MVVGGAILRVGDGVAASRVDLLLRTSGCGCVRFRVVKGNSSYGGLVRFSCRSCGLGGRLVTLAGTNFVSCIRHKGMASLIRFSRVGGL